MPIFAGSQDMTSETETFDSINQDDTDWGRLIERKKQAIPQESAGCTSPRSEAQEGHGEDRQEKF